MLVFFVHFFKIDAFSAVGKEFSCNAGDPVLIPGLGRSPGEGIGYLFQYSWASLVTQLVKNPPAMWETWVRSLGWEDPPEKGMAISNFLEEISSLFKPIAFLYFFALVPEETFLISSCYSLEPCIQMFISFLFASLLFTAICKASPAILLFCISFLWEWS